VPSEFEEPSPPDALPELLPEAPPSFGVASSLELAHAPAESAAATEAARAR
jgi:hypothetical protein